MSGQSPKSSPSYFIRRNLHQLEATARRTVEKATEYHGKKPPTELSHEKKIEWLKELKCDVEKQVILLDGIISKANNLEREWKEQMSSAKDGEWEKDVLLYEDYLYEEDNLFDQGNKVYSERASLMVELNRINAELIECQKISNEATTEGRKGKSLEELIEKLVTTSKPPTLNPVEFDGNPRMWCQFISQFEESIHKRTDLTPTQKFMHLLSTLKGEAREEISDLMVNDENYSLAMKNLYERYGDKKQRIKELYKSMERIRCSKTDSNRTVRQLLNMLSQLKAMGENIEASYLDVLVTERIPENMAKGLRRMKIRDPEWTMEDTIKYLKEELRVEEDYEQKPPERIKVPTGNTNMQGSKPDTKFMNERSEIRRTIVYATKAERTPQNEFDKPGKEGRLPCVFCKGNHWNDKCDTYPEVEERLEKLKQLRLCELCLKRGHEQENCMRTMRCYYCGSNHNSALCKSTANRNSKEREMKVMKEQKKTKG